MQHWFSGKAVSFQQADGSIASQTISLIDLIANFKAALASRSIKVIDAMWSGNENLHTGISTQVNDKKTLSSLLNSLLSSKMKKDFIIDCLAYFKVEIRQACLDAKQQKTKRSAYLTTTIKCLQVSLDRPSALNTTNTPDHSQNNLIINSINDPQPMLTTQPQLPQKRKHDTPFEHTASATKKQRPEYIGDITSSQDFTTTPQTSIEQLIVAPIQDTPFFEGSSSNVLEENNSVTDVAINQYFNNDNLFDDDWSWLDNIDTAPTASTSLAEKKHVAAEEQHNHISSFGDANHTLDSSFAWLDEFSSGQSPKPVGYEDQYSTYHFTDEIIRQTSLSTLTCNNEAVSDPMVTEKPDSSLNTPTFEINNPFTFFRKDNSRSITNKPDLLLDLPAWFKPG